MPDNLVALCFASICVLIGAVLLYDGVSTSDVTQTARVIAGARVSFTWSDGIVAYYETLGAMEERLQERWQMKW